MIQFWETALMTTFQTQFLSELAAGHDGPEIPAAKRAFFQERLRGRVFEFILNAFLKETKNGLNKAKLGRRIGKRPEVINRWLGSPSNLELDTISDLLLGIGALEPNISASSYLGRGPTNYSHLRALLTQQDDDQAADYQPPRPDPKKLGAQKESQLLGAR